MHTLEELKSGVEIHGEAEWSLFGWAELGRKKPRLSSNTADNRRSSSNTPHLREFYLRRSNYFSRVVVLLQAL